MEACLLENISKEAMIAASHHVEVFPVLLLATRLQRDRRFPLPEDINVSRRVCIAVSQGTQVDRALKILLSVPSRRRDSPKAGCSEVHGSHFGLDRRLLMKPQLTGERLGAMVQQVLSALLTE